jgi:iron(III) transport system ATP-binding protein
MKDVRGGVTFSVRPQSLKLSSVETGDFALQAQVVQRAYLGDVWDYVVQAAGSDLQLRVSAAPSQTFDVGESVWLELDPAQMALIR